MGKFSYLKPGDKVAVKAHSQAYYYRKIEEVTLDKVRIHNRWFDIYTGENLDGFGIAQLFTPEEAEVKFKEFVEYTKADLAVKLELQLLKLDATITESQLFREKILEALNLCEFPKPL